MSKSRWEQSVWNSFVNKLSGLVRPGKKSRRRSLPRLGASHSPAQLLEERVVPAIGVSFNAGTGALQLSNATAAAEAVVVTASSTATTVSANGTIISTIPGATTSTLKSVDFSGGTGGAATDSLTVVGITGTFSVALGNTGTLSLNSGNLTVTSSGPFAFGNTGVNGTLNVTAGGDVTDTGRLIVSGATTIGAGANNITLNSTGNSFGSLNLTGANVTISEAAPTDLAAVTATNFTLTSTGTVSDTGKVDVSGLTTITATGRDVALDFSTNDFNDITVTAANITLRDADDIDLNSITASGTLRVTAGTTIDDTTTVNATGATTLSGTVITLDRTSNTFGTLAITSTGATTIVENAATDLGASSITGALTVTSAGAITDSGKISAGATTLATNLVGGSLFSIVLDQTQSTYGTMVLTGTDLTVFDAGAIDFGAVSATGALTVQAGGDITQSAGIVSATGTTTLTALSSDITLNSANLFGTLVLRGVDVGITENAATNLGASLITGKLTLISSGAITDSGKVNVTGATSLSANAGGADITVDTAGGTFGTLTLTGNNVTLVEAAASDFAASTINGNFNLTASGVVTQSGAIDVTGVATINAGAAAITLNNAGNDFASLVLRGANITIQEASATVLGNTTASGTLSVTSGATITDTGTITATGTTTVSGTGVTLDSAANTFGTLLITATATGATIVENASTDLGATSVTGTLSVTSTGGITDSGNVVASGATTLTSVGKAITLDATGNNFASVNVTGGFVTIREASATTLAGVTATGNFTLISGGVIDNTGNLNVTGRATFTAPAASTVTINQTNNFGSVAATGSTISILENSATDLGPITATGTLTVDSQGAITDSGLLTITGGTTLDANGNAITLNFATAKYGTAGLALTGTSAVIVNSGAIDLNTSTLTGTLTVTAKSLTDSAALDVTGKTTITTGAGAVTLDSANKFGTLVLASGNTTINEAASTDLGASKISGFLTLTSTGAVTDSGTQAVTGALTITATGQDITLDDAKNSFGGNISFDGDDVHIVDTTAIVLGSATAITSTTLRAKGNITDTAALALAGTTTLTAIGGDITLNDSGTLGTISVNGKSASITNNNAAGIDFGASTLNGTLTLSANGDVTQAAGGVLTIVGNVSINAGSNDVTLTEANNTFARISVTGDAVSVTEKGATELGAITATNGLALVTTGTVNDFGLIAVTGATSINAGGNGVTLDFPTSDFGTSLALTAGHVAISNTGPVVFNTSTITGTLTVTAAGISDVGALTVTGQTKLSVGTNDVSLTTAGASFGTLLLSGANATIVESAGGATTDLGATNLTGSLTLTSTGAITDSGALDIDGAASFTSNTNAAITLDTATNNFGGQIAFNGGATTITDSTAIDLLASDTNNGNLIITAGGAVTDSGDVTAGTGSVTINATGFDITLDGAGGTYGTMSLRGANVTIVDSAAADLGASTITGTFNLTAGGNVTQSGAVSTLLTTTIDATGFDITLSNTSNVFGTLLLTANNATISEGSATDLGASTLAAALSVTSTGAITDTGTLTVTTTSTFSTGLTGASITLDDGSSDFTGAVSLTGGNVSLRDATATDLALVNATGSLSIQSGGDITNSGNVSVTGAASFNAVGNDVTVTTGTVNFGSVSAVGDTVTIDEDSATVLGTITAAVDLIVDSLGAVTDIGVITVTTDTDIDATGFDITLDTPTSNYGNGVGVIALDGVNVALRTNAPAVLDVITTTGTLGITATGNISESGAVAITAGTTSSFDAGSGDITLVAAANTFGGSVGLRGNDATFTVAAGVDLGNVTLSGLFTLTAGGAITDSGTVRTTGVTTLDAGAANDITLDSVGNSFGSLDLTGADIVIVEAAATSITAVTAVTLDVSSSGAINQTGPIGLTGAVANTGVFSAPGFSITLTDAGNDFGGAGSTTAVRGLNVTITDTNDFALESATVTGNLTIDAAGDVTSAGILNITGSTDIDAQAANNITVGTGSSKFGGPITLNGNDVAITAGGALNFAAVTAANDFDVVATGAVSDTGLINVTNVTTISAPGNSITLDNNTNSFVADLVLTGTNIAINNVAATVIGATTATGTLSIVSGGNVTENGNITVTGATTIAATGSDITLGAGANTMSFTRLNLTADNVTITNSRATDLGTVTVGANLVLNSTAGAVTDSGTVTVTGTTTIDAGTFGITLNTADSSYTGAFTLDGSNIAITNNRNTDLGATTATGTLSVTANGTIDDSGVIDVGSTASFTATGSDITLDQANVFAAAISFSGDDAAVSGLAGTSNAVLGSATLTGDLTVDSNSLPLTSPGSVLRVAGDVILDAGTVNISVILSGSQIGGDLILSGADITVTTTGLVDLGAVTATGDFILTTTGTVIDNGVIDVGGITTIDAGTGSIVLDGASVLDGAISLNGANLTLNNTVPTILDTTTATGTLTITTTADDITDVGTLTIAGTTTLNVGNANDIILNAAGSTFGTLVLTADTADIDDAGAVDLGNISLTTDLVITAGGAITDSGVLTVGGNLQLNANGFNITLNSSTSTFTGQVELAGINIDITANAPVDFGGVVANGNLTVTVNGAITDSTGSGAPFGTAIVVIGNTTMNVGTNSITLDEAGRTFNGTVLMFGGSVSY